MKVLFTTNVPSPYRIDFFNELGKLCELTVLFESDTAKSRNTRWMNNSEINFKSIFLNSIKYGEAEGISSEILKYVSKKEFDIIIIGFYTSLTSILAIQYMKHKKIKFFISSDGGIIKKDKKIKYIIKKYLISSADYYLSSGSITSKYLEYYGANKKNIHLYPFTSVKKTEILTEPLCRDEKKNIKRSLNIKEEIMILSVGQFIYRKGYDLLLEAIKDIDEKVGVYIIGGKETEEYKNIKQKYNLKNVYFLDYMDKKMIKYFYKAADLFVLPTREDIWGLVINEAMAYGLPIITTENCVAGMEMIVQNKNGWIIQNEDIYELKDTINYAISINEESRMEMSKECISTATKFSIENMAERHIEIFNEYLNSKK